MNSITEFLRMAVIVTVVALGVYFGLGLLLPHREATTATAETTADQVFAGEPTSAQKSPEPTPSATAAADAAATGVPAPATAVSSEPVKSADANSATAAAPAPSSPTPAAPVTAAAISEPLHPAAAHTSRSRQSVTQAPPAFEALNAWWTAGSGSLKVSFVGQAASDHALVILLSSEAGDPASTGQHIQLIDAKGKAVNANWQAGNNAKVLVAKGLAVGRYTVVIQPDLADAQGQALGTRLHGPAFIQ